MPETLLDAPAPSNPTRRRAAPASDNTKLPDEESANGHAANGAAFAARGLTDRERREMRDAQEFELDALISGGESEDEHDHASEKRKGRDGKAKGPGSSSEEDEGMAGRVRL